MIPELQDHSNVANKEKAIGEVCRVIPGFAFKSKDLGDSGVPVVKIGSITGSGVVDLDSGQFLPEGLIEDRHEKYCLDQGDIVLAMTGEGKIGRIVDDRKSLLNQRVCKIEPLDEKDRAFLWVAIKSIDYSQLFAQLAKGAAQANISGGQIEAIRIAWPEARARNRIADILSSYDDLIENNRRRIKLLEESARLLYREWFVHLRFPGHEHVKVVDGVPEGWERKSLGEVAFLNYGRALKEQDRESGDFPVYGSSGIVGTHKVALSEGPGIIVGRKGNVGKIFWSYSGFFPIDTVYFVDAQASNLHLYYALQNTQFISTDVAVPGLNRDFAHSRPIMIPEKIIFEGFLDLIEPIHQQINNFTQYNTKLRQARDLLLPRLMSGEIAV